MLCVSAWDILHQRNARSRSQVLCALFRTFPKKRNCFFFADCPRVRTSSYLSFGPSIARSQRARSVVLWYQRHTSYQKSISCWKHDLVETLDHLSVYFVNKNLDNGGRNVCPFKYWRMSRPKHNDPLRKFSAPNCVWEINPFKPPAGVSVLTACVSETVSWVTLPPGGTSGRCLWSIPRARMVEGPLFLWTLHKHKWSFPRHQDGLFFLFSNPTLFSIFSFFVTTCCAELIFHPSVFGV